MRAVIPSAVEPIERETMGRVFRRLVPLLFLALFCNYLDRINIGFASLRMNADLHLDPAVFGFGASVFFAGYMLLEVPSNLMLHRLGARIWIARILITWGIVAAATAFAGGALGFSILRFLLGVAEAGFLPGLAIYVTTWFPSSYRARAVGGYIVAGQFAGVFGGPVSTVLITYANGFLGLHGWQWMFILEGLPAVILGFVFLAALTDRPEKATWLTPAQRTWLETRLADERRATEAGRTFRIADMLTDGRGWSLAILFGCALVGVYGLLIWTPQIIKAFGKLTDIQIGLLAAIPPLMGVLGQGVASFSSDRTGDRKYHLCGVYALGGVALAASALVHNAVASYVLLCIAGFGVYAGNPLFWSINASLMTGVAAAASIAFVNTIAQFGGLIGPWMIGAVRKSTGSFSLALLTIAAFLFVAAAIAAALHVGPRRWASVTIGPADAPDVP